mmetsp:Transcript_83896/g.151380  ORF Transcript_83896/g.151380 Transcript_83896/m.151380 type:complete len:255 (+) Transcript_83896:313-1077(+)
MRLLGVRARIALRPLKAAVGVPAGDGSMVALVNELGGLGHSSSGSSGGGHTNSSPSSNSSKSSTSSSSSDAGFLLRSKSPAALVAGLLHCKGGTGTSSAKASLLWRRTGEQPPALGGEPTNFTPSSNSSKSSTSNSSPLVAGLLHGEGGTSIAKVSLPWRRTGEQPSALGDGHTNSTPSSNSSKSLIISRSLDGCLRRIWSPGALVAGLSHCNGWTKLSVLWCRTQPPAFGDSRTSVFTGKRGCTCLVSQKAPA